MGDAIKKKTVPSEIVKNTYDYSFSAPGIEEARKEGGENLIISKGGTHVGICPQGGRNILFKISSRAYPI